jgi:hypothetical protein
MSQTAIFVVGIVIFTLTIWGSVMIGGYWLGEIADSEADRVDPGTGSPPPSAESPPSP